MRHLALLVLLASCDRVFGTLAVEPWTAVDGAQAAGCPGNYTVRLPPSTSAYRIELGALNWLQAAAVCAQDGVPVAANTHLAVLSDMTELVNLYGLLQVETWIGYSDRVIDNEFKWVTAEPGALAPVPQQPPWQGNDPDEPGLGCVSFDVASDFAEIHDTPCDRAFAFACECDAYPNQPDRYVP